MKHFRVSSGYLISKESGLNVTSHIEKGTEFHKKMGFDTIDFSMDLIEPLGSDWKKCIEHALLCSEREGVKIELCHLPFSTRISSFPEELPAFNQKMHYAIDAAAMLGVNYAVLHPNAISIPLDQYNHQEQKDSVLHHLTPFVEHAQKVGVNIVVENMRAVPSYTPSHRYCQDPEEVCEVADALGIGICWDFGHAHIAQLKQSEALACVSDRLKVVHINDNRGEQDEHIPPFCGTVDWKDAMQGLANIGFAGLLNYELDVGRIPPVLMESYARYILDAAAVMESYMDNVNNR